MCAMKEEAPKRILITDDDIDLLMLLERRLVKEGYLVETAASLPEAEEIMVSYLPDLVLLDINLKGQDGRQLSWKIRMWEEHRHTKVIIMSGYDFSLGRAVLFGADELIPKPINMEFLLHRITQLLELPDAGGGPSPVLSGEWK